MVEKQNAQKKKMVYDSVLAEIIRGVYNVSSIITEGSLIEKYNVSKSPVREALLELCNDGVISSIPRTGYRVLPLNYHEMTQALQVRTIIELSALEMTFSHLDDAMIAKLEASLQENKKKLDTHDAYLHWTMNTNFHLQLCSYSGNKYLTQTLDSLLKVCLLGAPKYFGESWENKLDRDNQSRHCKLLQSMRERNLEQAKEILKKDISDFSADFLVHE